MDQFFSQKWAKISQIHKTAGKSIRFSKFFGPKNWSKIEKSGQSGPKNGLFGKPSEIDLQTDLKETLKLPKNAKFWPTFVGFGPLLKSKLVHFSKKFMHKIGLKMNKLKET